MLRTILLASASLAIAPATAQSFDSAAISGLGVRNIGSATMSGRIAAVTGRQEKDGKVTLLVGSASGGVWKSEDGGTTFKPVFDKQPVESIGAVALDSTNKDVMWVGTGESWTRNSVSVGNGVYKSTDGGETWTNMGLPNSERITRIIVHPKNGNIVYVCVPGALWSDSPDRGLYKTIDGGRTWALILKGANLSTGCSSIAMDPANPEHLLAGTWDFRRKPYEYRSGGDGPDKPSGSRFAESRDGGKTWTYLTGENRIGLPAYPWGRTEIAFSPSNPKQVYAFIENLRSALYVSENGGLTWEERDRSQGMVWRPFYFARIVVDPKDPQRLFKMGYSIIASEDGGKSFANAAGGSHGDWHDVWINPTDTKYIVGGDDGGLWYTHDGGVRWWKANNLPVSQFYHVSTDNKDPFQVYGGLQDNSSWVGDSEYPGGITNNRWENLYGGDGFWAFSDPSDPNFAYAEAQGGHIGRINRHTLEQRDIQPKGGYKEKLRYNWNTPIALSPNEKGTIYIGAQFLFRSRDHGVTWDRISPDLTTNDPIRQRQEQSGGITVDNSSAEMNTTIYSISESPRAAGQIWVGTDDGNVQLTRDGGKNWTNVTPNIGMPTGNWISTVEASRFNPAVAYVTDDRHTYGDMAPYLYRTTDYGRTWHRLVGPGTPGVRGYAYVIKEDRENPNILFLGTEFGLFISLNGGQSWAQFKPGNMPDGVAVRDIALQERDDDLVLATHGRGIWVIDDISPLRQLSSQVLMSNAVLLPGKPVEQRIQGNGGWAEGDASYAGDNPPSGATITYFQKARHVIGRMKLEILDAQGNVVDEVPASKRRGLNRVTWSMRTKAPQVPPAASLAGASAFGERFLPGTYTVRLTKAGEVSTEPLTVILDKRATFTVSDRQAQFAAAERVKGMFARMSTLVGQINGVRDKATSLASGDAPADIKAAANRLNAKADELRKEIVATKEGGAITGEERLREHTDDVYGAINSVEDRPTNYQMARIDALDRELKDVETAWAAFQSEDLARFNVMLKGASLPPLTVAEVAFDPEGQPRGGRAAALARGLVGAQFHGETSLLVEQGEKD
jgi:photosystem II stability/assembly factor-like uncharacterized protein